MRNKKYNHHFPRVEDRFNEAEGRSINGSITRKYYYKNGQKCDVFGRTINDVGYTPVIGIEQHRPISYPNSIKAFEDTSTNSKKNYHKMWGLDQSLLLRINKNKLNSIFEQEFNVRGTELLNSVNQRMIETKRKNKTLHFKIFNPGNKNVSRQIVSDDLLWYYMNYPLQVRQFEVPKVAFKKLNINDDILNNYENLSIKKHFNST